MRVKLEKARLIKRYKRFLADILLPSNEQLTIYCPNTGAMTDCGDAGDEIWYSHSHNPNRKYQQTWELTHSKAGHWICVNTAKANQLVALALENGEIDELQGYANIQAEVKYGTEKSRVDFLLTDEQRTHCYVEVKSCTLLDERFGKGQGFFPDTVTLRGQKHLRELIAMKQQGQRSVLLFAVLHSGIHKVAAAAHIDKQYGLLFEQAKRVGVEVICFYPNLYEYFFDL
ncbi:DNA/RNA nuclease SfsA [Psychromonas antarctica]|uniref:DNA/RNA nuclease SfsA n=1 Tax=Psychromonas antarctica TaxID=67573 RepID=UPI001EE8D0AA|nr:DNA/RNA nuclease SfsA [Psychromonas antarctica]MCG6201823.1 DNA/RNA nuclease SfsA [Psychromonas antarctica]